MRSAQGLRNRLGLVRNLVLIVIGIGAGPTPVAARPFAYVTNYDPACQNGSVSVIDVATGAVVGSPLAVGGCPAKIAITPDGTYVYVANGSALNVIATATNIIVGSPIATGAGIEALAISPDGVRVYVVHSGPVACCGSVRIVDTATGAIVGTPIAVGSGPSAIAITPDGAFAYVVNEGFTSTGFAGSVSVINTATNTVTGSPIPVGIAPGAIAISPDGARAYVANNRNGFVNDGTVTVINTATNTVAATILVGTDAVANDLEGIAITPDGTRAYVTQSKESTNGGSVAVIDTATNTVGASTIPVGDGPMGIAITSDGTRAGVANDNDKTVSLIDTTTNTVVGSPISVPGFPVDVAIAPGPVCVAVSISDLDATPKTLWPPSHDMVSVTLAPTTSGCSASCEIVRVESNEPINGLGDGDTAPDWLVTGNLTVALRAERGGLGTGRIYAVTVRCTDTFGDVATKTVNVTVPVSQRQ